MARLAGVDLPANKRIEIGLTYIYGIGRSLSKVILDKIGVDGSIKVKDLSESDVVKLRDALKQVVVEGDHRKEVSMDIKRLIDIGAYRGIRHKKGLPARGQRTRTNGRTRRGKRKTVGRGKKEEK
ncbi:MAG: 30S ribosomal protein S13 [Candidatus Margulisiibacteriota bacterium]